MVIAERRRGRVVRAARLWKSEFEAGFDNWKTLCQPSSKWVPFFELGKDKAAKGDAWAPPFIRCAQDTVGF